MISFGITSARGCGLGPMYTEASKNYAVFEIYDLPTENLCKLETRGCSINSYSGCGLYTETVGSDYHILGTGETASLVLMITDSDDYGIYELGESDYVPPTT